MERWHTLVFALAAMLLSRPAPAAGTLVVISPHNEAIREEFERGFARWTADRLGAAVDIDWRVVGGSSEAIRFVQSEFARKPDGIGVDVFFGGGQEPFYELAEKGWSAPCPLPAPVLDGLPAEIGGIELRDPAGRWYGSAVSTFGILENLRVQKLAGLPRVERWEDLADPRLMGWVGAGDPRGSGTMHVMFESFLQARGWEEGWRLLTCLAGNTRRFDRISTTTAKDAALGETAYALAIDFYAFSQIASAGRTNLTFVLPSDFSALVPDGVAVLRGAPNAALACQFLEFVLSDAGQELWLLPVGHPGGPTRHSIERMPVRPDLYRRHRAVSNVESSPFERVTGFRYDARLAQQRRGVVATMAGALFVDVHPDLQRAWRSVVRRGATPEHVRQLGTVPISEQEARELSAGPWKDSRTRNAYRTSWQTWARTKYRSLAETTP